MTSVPNLVSIHPFSLPATIVTDAAHTPIYLVGLGNNIEHLILVSFLAAYLTSYVVTLIATDEVELHKLPVLDEDPIQLAIHTLMPWL